MLEHIFEFTKSNPVVAGIVSLYGVGLLTYLCKDIPTKCLLFLKKHFTTTVSIGSINNCFLKLMDIFDKANIVNKSRAIKLVNGKYGYRSTINKIIGSGLHLFFYRGIPLWVSLQEQQMESSMEEKMTITITKIGRSHKIFDDIKIELEEDKADKLMISEWDGGWSETTSLALKNLDCVFIEKEKKQKIIRHLENFYKDRLWYEKRGIPYQTGIALYGVPGTGKTSILKALATYFKKNIYVLKSSQLYSLSRAVATLPNNCFLVIEDIDSNTAIHSRENNSEEASAEHSAGSLIKELSNLSLSEILNSIDGLVSVSGRIMLITTNHLEKLDMAFMRPGRIDLTVEIGHVTQETFSDFVRVFYEKEASIKVKDKLTIAELQGKFLNGFSLEEMIDYVALK